MPGLARPLTPPDCDVRDYPRMMVDIRRLQDSAFNRKASANPLAWMVGHKLWYRAFHQFPAGSLPTDEGELCSLAELGLDMKAFRKAKPLALHGWKECSDGRLYHAFVAEVVLEAWVDKLLLKLKSGAGNSSRHKAKGYAFDPAPTILSLETAGVYLADLNPESRGLDKIRRRSERAPQLGVSPDVFLEAVRQGSERAPTGNPLGAHSDSENTPSDVRVGSQAKAEAKAEEINNTGLGAREPIDQARRAQVASLQAQVMAAGGHALADIAAAPALANLSPVLNLLEPGDGPSCDLELDVLPVIRQRCARLKPRSIRSWNFFTDAIVEARDARLRGAPKQSEVSHEHSRRPVRPEDANADSRRANTERRRDAWAELIEERDSPTPGREGHRGGQGGPEPDDPSYPRLAYAGDHS